MQSPAPWAFGLTRANLAWAWFMDKVGGRDRPWANVDVAHLDTGITEHPSLALPWAMRSCGVNFVEGGEPIDPMTGTFAGHGTRTCSVLCGSDTNYSGVAPGLTAIPYRVTNGDVVIGEKREVLNIARAIRHAIDENACEVITISLGYPVTDWGISTRVRRQLGEAVDYAYERGVIICAAGGQPISSFCYPGKFFRAIGVGGYKPEGEGIAIYQDYDGPEGVGAQMNEFADVWGPAVVTRANALSSLPYGPGDGTSFATPHVAATAAMWLASRGAEIEELYSEAPWMRVEAFRLLLKTSAVNISGSRGFGQIVPGPDGPLKGSRRGNGTCWSGGLDMYALLTAELPQPATLLQEKRLAANQTK